MQEFPGPILAKKPLAAERRDDLVEFKCGSGHQALAAAPG
jgi:hypothetical protein